MSFQHCAIRHAIDAFEKKGKTVAIPCTGKCTTCALAKLVYGHHGPRLFCPKSRIASPES